MTAWLRAAVLRALHGYRPGRGCHTAMREVARTWTGTSWFIEGDLAQCFDRLDHQVTLETLGEKIHGNRLLRLVGQMLLEKDHTAPRQCPYLTRRPPRLGTRLKARQIDQPAAVIA